MDDWYLKKCSSKKKVLLRTVHSAKKEESMLICCSSYSEFQILDVDTGELSKTGFTLLGDCGIGSIVSIGSVIYTIGMPQRASESPDFSDYYSELKGENDIFEVHEGMSYFDLAHPELGWRKAPLFTEDNHFPNCVAHCGKLFVFRSSKNGSCFAQVFDPNSSSNSWDPLPLPSPLSGREFQVSSPVLSDPLGDRILVNLNLFRPYTSPIYAYYPATATWECLVHDFDGVWAGPAVFVDGVIYFYARKSRQLVEAYDLAAKQWLKVVLSSHFEEDYSRNRFHALHHLGNGLLCFTTFYLNFQNFDPSIEKDHTVVVSVQFKVHRTTPSSNQLFLTPLSAKSSAFQSCCRIYGHIAI